MAKDQQIQKKLEVVQDAREKSYSFVVVTLIVVLVLVIFAIQPTLVTISRITTEIEQKKRISKELDTKIKAIASLSKQYNDETYGPMFSDLALLFPGQGDFSLMMANIYSLASKNGLELTNIGFDAPDTTFASKELNLDVLKPWKTVITVKGRRENLIPYLKELEQLPNYPAVDAISFANSADEQGNLMFSISLRIYKVDESNFYGEQ